MSVLLMIARHPASRSVLRRPTMCAASIQILCSLFGSDPQVSRRALRQYSINFDEAG